MKNTADKAQMPSEVIVIRASRRCNDQVLGRFKGTTRQEYKKIALISMPIGTTASEAEIAISLSEFQKNPYDAGTIVVGKEPNSPPIFPPNRSIETVASIAINPARTATNTDDINQTPSCIELLEVLIQTVE